MNLNTRESLLQRLRRSNKARQRLVESHIDKGVAFQIRAIRERLGWSQKRLSEQVDMNQNAISRLESPYYGKATISTLKRLAAAFDVALIVRFVPFSELADWVSGTPHTNRGLTTRALAVPSFGTEEALGTFDRQPSQQVGDHQDSHRPAGISGDYKTISVNAAVEGSDEIADPESLLSLIRSTAANGTRAAA